MRPVTGLIEHEDSLWHIGFANKLKVGHNLQLDMWRDTFMPVELFVWVRPMVLAEADATGQ